MRDLNATSPQRRATPADAAIALAAEALAWIAGQEALLAELMAASGAAPDEMRARVADPEFLGFVLDFLLSDEAALLAFCENRGVPPDQPMRARAMLPGGDLPHWT